MRILFILKESNMNERLGVMLLSSVLKSNGHEVKLVLAERIGFEKLDSLFKSYCPAIAGYSAMTGEHKSLLEINKLLKKNHKFSAVFGGPHATFFPKIIEEEGCDAVCVGEGDISFPEYCRRVEHGEAYWETHNFIVKYKGRIHHNPLMPFIENLDSLPFPDRDLMYNADPDLLEEGHKVFFSTRGCPYKCAYCFNNKYNEMYKGKGGFLRHRSPENVIGEIEQVKNQYLLNFVLIEDDTFLIKPKGWFERFCELYKKINLPLSCNVHPSQVTEEKIAQLKEAGLDSVSIGIECGNEEIAKNILGRTQSNKQIINACRILQKYNVKIVTANLNGLPVPNSFQVDLQTLDLNINIKPTFAWSSIIFPYPGTPIESYARSHGFLWDNTDFLETNKRSSVFSFSSPLEKRKIENLHKLFGLIVEFPILRKFTTFLCVLPLKPFYTALFYFWYGYNYKIRIWPLSSLKKELGKYVLYWWKLIQKS